MTRRDWTRKPKITLLRNVRVCAGCKRASCAQGVWPCSSPSRGILLPIETVQFLERETEEFWSQEWADAAKARGA